jgi:hypothetical protein
MFSKKALAASVSAGPATYIEDVFSTFLYTGTGATQTITNGIDLSGKGGLLWIKNRTGANNNILFDTSRGANNYLYSNLTNASAFSALYNQSFTTSGFGIGSSFGEVNATSNNYASWTFREQPKFFDVVTYTADGSASQIINHNLGSVPGMVICKNITTNAFTNGDWRVWHRGNGTNPVNGLSLNATDAALFPSATNAASFTSTTFDAAQVIAANGASGNQTNGIQYVAYLFAHNAGGFGAAGTDNVISCGSYTDPTGTSMPTVNLGWEPQFLIIRGVDGGSWWMFDSMRGMPATNNAASALLPNSNGSEITGWTQQINATGFTHPASTYGAGTFIYIAIRRPMKTPTSGTSVFSPVAYNGTNSAGQVISGVGFSPDLTIPKYRAGSGGGAVAMFIDRLRGGTAYLAPSSTAAEGNTAGYYVRSFDMDGTTFGTAYVDYTNNANTYVDWFFRRAPGFFDVVCYTGTGSARSLTHNLGVAPELLIVKRRTSSGGSFTDNWVIWTTYASPQQNAYSLSLNLAGGWTTVGDVYWGSSSSGTPSMTSTTFSLGTYADVNANAATYVAYLFATVAGVSKVGSYTGNGSSQTINCSFTAGARFVMIKRTDTSGAWYVWDTARGIVSGNDPRLSLNSTAAEVTTDDSIDPDNSGFIVNQVAATDVNVNGSTYIFLAIA